ncbi:MAG TPA: hypothetical protein VFC63_27505 [Blastocatellia bacterium]|nr:hypothetical protein [Blastocatellia bacterium]
MNIRINQLSEPKLEFGNGVKGIDPKPALTAGGPFASDSIREIQLGLVCFAEEEYWIRSWIERMHNLISSEETNAKRFIQFPGLDKAFRSRFTIPNRFVRYIDRNRYARLIAQRDHRAFEELLELIAQPVHSLFGDDRPACVLVGFSEELATLRVSNPRLSYQEQQFLQRIQRDDEANQLQLFDPSEDEKRFAAELIPQSEELLFRNFHRALKAKCMGLPNPVPLQVVRRQTYMSDEAKQSDATRAWNLAVAIYYKAGNIPWRPADLTKSTCFVGLSFHHLKRRSGDLVYASLAQAFSTDVEPFTLKGASVPHDQTINKRPYLTAAQAASLTEDVLRNYSDRAGGLPSRIVIHKTSRYQPDEQKGFRDTALSSVGACDLAWLNPTGFRLLRRGMKEPARGTLCTIADDNHYLFTTGYVEWWGEYPGPHIPSPVQVGSPFKTDIEERSREILALTKMNWNSADGLGRNPITISFARRVGMIMTELDEDAPPNPLFRFYM